MNESNIVIFDNFLNDTELNTVKQQVYNLYWKYGHGNGDKEKVDTKYFSNFYIDEFITEYVKNKIENQLNKPLNITRNYLQIQEFGENGGYHIDSDEPNSYTFTLYITDLPNEDIENANGEFLLKIPHKSHIVSIDTYCNRAIFFPANYLHKGMAYNVKYTNKRICIAWKFIEII
jgi:hypothetical protein